MKAKLRSYLTKQLRRAFNYSPLKRELMRTLPNCCARCLTTEGPFDLDHVCPVVPPDRDIDSLEYFMRLFSLGMDGSISFDNFEKLCKLCHATKSRGEMALRAKLGTGPYSQASKDKAAATRARRSAVKKRRRKKPSCRKRVASKKS